MLPPFCLLFSLSLVISLFSFEAGASLDILAPASLDLSAPASANLSAPASLNLSAGRGKIPVNVNPSKSPCRHDTDCPSTTPLCMMGRCEIPCGPSTPCANNGKCVSRNATATSGFCVPITSVNGTCGPSICQVIISCFDTSQPAPQNGQKLPLTISDLYQNCSCSTGGTCRPPAGFKQGCLPSRLCNPGLQCSLITGKCLKQVNGACVADTDCVVGGCQGGVCTVIPLGASCAANPNMCDQDLSCSKTNQTCLISVAEKCDKNTTMCNDGLYCKGGKYCVPTTMLGDFCLPSDVCDPGLACDWGSGYFRSHPLRWYTIQAWSQACRASTGGKCRDSTDCQSGLQCTDGACTAIVTKLDNDASCQMAAECTSGVCRMSTGKCAAQPATCMDGTDCLQGMVCMKGACAPPSPGGLWAEEI